jgi:Bacterial Ig-like domain
MNQPSKRFALSASAVAVSLLVAACGGGGGGGADPGAPDAVAPTLVIDDNISADTAKGAVTFTFTFSEPVGDSFKVTDAVVTGGTPGTLIKVNDAKYLLEVTPAASSQGMLRVTVAASAYADLKGNLNAAASTHEQGYDTMPVVPPPASGDVVLASFDEATPLVFEGFNGAETSSIAAGPAGGSGNAGKIVRLGGEVWAGAKVNTGPIALTANNRTISARVYSPLAGVPMVLKLENAGDPGINTGDLQATQAVVAGWQTLTWVVPADKVGPEYSWVVMLPNLGTLASADPGETYYFDDIKLVVPPVSADLVLATFDETTALAFEGFNGAETSSIAAGPAGGTGNAGRIIRLGGEVWAGAKVNVGPIPLTAGNRTISARVHSPLAGVPMVLKLENAGDPGINTGDLQATQTVVAGWQTLTWVVPADKVGPEYSWVVMLPNLGTRASSDPGETYYFDDIQLTPGP